MPWRGPEYEGEFPSLGWDIIDWWEDHLIVPSGPKAGEPLRLTDDQQSFFARLYAVSPATGRRVYRRASRRGAKGRGKSPEGAMFLLADMCAPVVFDGWNAAGEPVGKPRHNPLGWAVAVAEEQTDNVYGAMLEMAADAGLPLDLGKTRVEFTDGRPGEIKAVTSSAGAREGALTTAVVLDETHLWFPSQGGHKLAAVIRRNVAKTGDGQTLEVSNAPALGGNSVAELTLDAAAKGQRGLLYDSVEAEWHPDDDPKDPANKAKVMAALRQSYAGVSIAEGGWVDLDRQYEDAMDVDTTRADVVRFAFNIAGKAENRAFDTRHVAACTKKRRKVPAQKILMFDGARTRDCAVLSSWTLEPKPHHQMVQAWLRPHDPHATYEHPRGEIRAAVRDFLAANECALFVYDSSFHELSSLYDEWIDEHEEANVDKGEGLMVGYPTASGQRMDHAIKRVREDMREARLTHDGDEIITEHLENAVLEKNRSGWLTLAKEKDSLKIDGAVTFTFGYDMIQAGRDMAANRQAAPAIYVGMS